MNITDAKRGIQLADKLERLRLATLSLREHEGTVNLAEAGVMLRKNHKLPGHYDQSITFDDLVDYDPIDTTIEALGNMIVEAIIASWVQKADTLVAELVSLGFEAPLPLQAPTVAEGVEA